MSKSGEEKRQHKRVLFTVEDGIVGVFYPPGVDNEPVTATVVNMSSGGVKLIFKSVLDNNIKEGDRLILSELRGAASSQVIVDIDTEVKWISDDELTEDIGLGVEFLNVLEDNQQQIDDMVEFWYLQKI